MKPRTTFLAVLAILVILSLLAPAALAAAPQPGCHYPGPYHLGFPVIILACVSSADECPQIVSGPAALVKLVCVVAPALHR